MITSTANEQVKLIRKLRERKYRAESGTFYIEGIRIVREAMEHPQRIKMLIVAPELLQSLTAEEALTAITGKGVPILEVSKEVFESFGLKENPQGLAAVVKQSWSTLNSLDPKKMGLWVGLDAVADPGNLGTIMRTMDAVGARGVFLIGDCTDPYDLAAVRGSMGAVFMVEFIKTSIEVFASWKKAHKLPIYGTSDAAKVDYQSVEYPRNMILLMGSERQGLHQELLRCCDEMVSIPMVGRSDSLNLAVATAVTLYEIFNQYRKNEAE
jgi:TrmH family RNA methyltransferase